ncbi:LysE family transporter [Micromonospora sp. NPDC049559]|uniref:LysE/ArgO family amino acid transporter n=1 Tax=Micromonospora sp. NPDC049559 TaxID=3155923 RepID=UPI003420A753
MSAVFAGMLAGYGVAIPVGAIAILVMGLAARAGWRVGAAAAMGVATADGIYAASAVLGGAVLAGLIEPVARPLRWLAAGVLVWMAGRAAVRAVRDHHAKARSGSGLTTPGRAYGALLALTLLNPMTVVYFAALVLGRQAADGLGPAGELLFAAGAFVASASWQLLIAIGGSLVGRLLAGPRGQLATALVSSLLMLVLALGTVTGRLG